MMQGLRRVSGSGCGPRGRRLHLLCLLAGLTAATASAASLDRLHIGTAHEAFFDLAFHADKGLAVGAAGSFMKTLDGGRSWQRQHIRSLDHAILGVAVQAGRSLAVGQEGLILLSEEEDQWQRIAAPTESRLFDVSLNTGGLAAAVGEFGSILVSHDGGRKWQALSLNWPDYIESLGGIVVEPHLYSVHVAEDGSITLAGEFGLILRSTDLGRQWQILHRGEASIFSLDFLPDGHAYAVGQDGFAIASQDHGASWRVLPVGSEANLLDICAAGDGRIAISGIREFWFSDDHGANWSRVSGAGVERMWFQAVARNANNDIYAVGQGASVLRLGR